MKIFFKENKIIIFLYKTNIDFDINIKKEIEESLKKIILSIKKRYNLKISGVYKVSIYENKKFGLIIELDHTEDFAFFPDVIDLKITIYNDSSFYLKFNDYFIINKKNNIYFYDNNYYIDINMFEDKELLLLSEFYNISYGNDLERVRNNMKQI